MKELLNNPWTGMRAAHGTGGWRDVLQAHGRQTVRRMSAETTVLCMLETLELSLESLYVEERHGVSVHPTHAVSVRREPLGLLNVGDRIFEFEGGDARPGEVGEVGESLRWLESYEHLVQHARELPQTRLVCVGDRGSPMLGLMARARDLGHPVDYLVHCRHNRVLPGEGGKTWAALAQDDPLGRVAFETPSGHGRRVRTVTQELHTKRVSLSDGQGGTVAATCVLARELAPPASQPMTWRLLTNRSVDTLEQATEAIHWYCARWAISPFSAILKEGCRNERVLADEEVDFERLEVVLAKHMVAAWHLNRLMPLGRAMPEMPADAVFDADEWRVAFILNKKPVPDQVPALNTVIRLIAQHGGFLGRKSDGEPGVRPLWQGLRQVAIVVEGLHLARSQAAACVPRPGLRAMRSVPVGDGSP